MMNRLALASALLVSASAFVSSTLAGFQINAVKTDKGATDVVELYFFNDGQNNTGTALEAYEVTYTGTPLTFDWIPATSEDPGYADIYNHANDTTKSWFRVHPSRHYVYWSSPNTGDVAWSQPITNFTITYATFELIPVKANTGNGARFGRLVIPDGADFTVAGKVGGEVGGAATVSFNHPYFIANVAPSIAGDGMIDGGGADAEGLRTHRVTASDMDGLLTAFSLNDLDHALASGFGITPVGADAYDITWNPALVTPGTYRFNLLAQDSSVQANSSTTSLLSITVVPEPATAALLMAVAPLARRRRA